MTGYLDPDVILALTLLGAFAFGVVMGWITYRTLRRSQTSGLGDIATVLGAVGGAAVTALFEKGNGSFGAYCIGLALGFFFYLKKGSEPDAVDWLSRQNQGRHGGDAGAGGPPPGPPV